MPTPKPLRDDQDVSWVPHCHPGDDQGQTGACSVFAVASWAEVMLQRPIDDAVCIAAYRAERQRLHNGGDGGLYIPEAIVACATAGIIPPGVTCHAAPTLANLRRAPLVAEYETTVGWNRPNAAGCVDHAATAPYGRHAVLIVAHGSIGPDVSHLTRIVWIENSWGRRWGHDGFGVMTEKYHAKYCAAMWELRLPC
jgi:hypothetical protein